ncbi:MAG TPA: hypothetical protein VMS88_01945 [Terriglobales bacterium]|nr:hypothetical protein [Terriglobales bacterium]
MEGGRLFVTERPNVGIVLRDSFALFVSHVAQFVTITSLTLIPLIVFFVYVALTMPDPARAAPGPATVIGMLIVMPIFAILFLVGTQLASAALTYGVFQIERGAPLRIGSCLTIGLRRLPIVLLVSLAVGILALLGLVACIVPGILIALALSMAVPAAVVERHSVGSALRRSVDLTRGFRGIVFGSFAVLTLLQFAVNLVLGAVSLANQIVSTVLSMVAYVGFGSLQATVLAVLYYRLRAAKGALDVDQIAAVFE